MKTQLFYPYTFEERKPLFQEGVLFIPEFYQDQASSAHMAFNCQEWAKAMSHPTIYVEYCAGNGQWICQMAKNHPDILWIACELKFDRAAKIYKRIKSEKISNCLVAFGTAELLTKYYLKPLSISAVFVNFPDPWPKKKHAKHRLFQQEFLSDLKKIMKKGSILTLATDDQPYLEESVEALNQAKLTPVFQAPFYTPLDSSYGYSFFGDLWVKKGKINYQTKFINHD
jgi:tRNA (guanine-N7-)-methyltransferase